MIRILDYIYMAFNVFMAVLLILSGCALDSESTLPLKTCALCIAYFLWVAAHEKALAW